MKKINNPILKGFNPDPSIIRVGEDYYIATSTFEWFPGVQIHHSKDLINWEVIAQPLNRLSQLDMRGNPDSCGVWAPCLTYDNGIFYLVYSNVRSFDGNWKDTPNYLVTSKDILGDWSDPVYLTSVGFDGSLFHDDDGRKYFSSMIVDHRKGKLFGGIILREYDPRAQKLIGVQHKIFEGTELGLTEAPHFYRKGAYYYLITAEGGTEYGHAVTVARSKQITGPYEVHPDNPILTVRNHPSAPLQKVGHADLVQTQDGDWYIVFLVGRPLTEQGFCILGRETAIEQLAWSDDGWPYLLTGKVPRTEVPSIETTSITKSESIKYHFDQSFLSIDFQSLRVPVAEDWCTLTARSGFLRLYGRESLSSFHEQSLVARRIQHFDISVTTYLEFEPSSFQQMAGLIFYYNTYHFHYLHLSTDESTHRLLNIVTCDKHKFTEPLDDPIDIGKGVGVLLKAEMRRESLQFYYALTENDWHPIGPVLDASILSDDYVRDEKIRYRPAFTGAFVGLCCQDLTGEGVCADFDWMEYEVL